MSDDREARFSCGVLKEAEPSVGQGEKAGDLSWGEATVVLSHAVQSDLTDAGSGLGTTDHG